MSRNLAKTGTPSRAEITDAAMGERAECVMLNKGPAPLAGTRSGRATDPHPRIDHDRALAGFEHLDRVEIQLA